MKTINVTDELLDQLKTEKGGYAKGTIMLLGADYPAKKGWKDKVIGSAIVIHGPDEVPGEVSQLELEHQPVITPRATTPSALLEMAVSQGADIDKLEKLMTLQERWQAGEAAKSFKVAMASFQAEKPELKKTQKASFSTKGGSGPVKSYAYASLPYVQRAIDPILSKFGLSYSWRQSQDNNSVTITCVVSHIDGHVEENGMTAPHDASGNKNQIQAIGSTVSYLKRYTLEGALGLATDKDDDGNTGNSSRKPELVPGTEKWLNTIKALGNGYTIEEVEGKYYLSPENRDKLLDESID